MTDKLLKKSKFLLEATLTSYSQIFFTENKILASILIVVSFMEWWTGLSGLIAVLTAIALAQLFDYSEITTEKGLYSFNALLVGLGIGTYFAPGLEVLLLIVAGAAIAFFSTVFFMGIFAKYGIPFLSIPFLVGMWLLLLAFPSFTNVALNMETLYPSNMYFKMGGDVLVSVMEDLSFLFEDTGFDTYFLSLGAIFFQFNILSGVMISLGLLIHSRVNFLLSLVGFFVAYGMYSYLGMYTGSLNYTYYGFNFILSAIAIGGYFLIPSRQSFLLSLLLIPVLVVTTIGSDRLFMYFELSAYSLPFNVIMIGVLYALKIRYDQTKGPILTLVHLKNPETNAYLFDSQPAKKYAAFTVPIRLPFMGKWTVNQAHNGKYTHKDFFRFAWDFIIKDEASSKEFSGEGLLVTDYYCYDKPVVAPALGTVVNVLNTVEDNEIGATNTLQNWGNTVVLQHENYLFSKLSHLKKGSIEVNIGDVVVEGQYIGRCGNSGRSPYPHLHFQLQSTSKIGATTLFWPLSEYLVDNASKLHFVPKGIPKEQDKLLNISISPILQSAFKWSPGDEFQLSMANAFNKPVLFTIRNEIDIYNQSFLNCLNTNAKLYYENNGKTFSALNYIGSKKSALFYFYSSLYKVVLSEHSELSVATRFPVHHLYRFPVITIQDFLVPFGIFLKGNYKLSYIESEQTFNPEKIGFKSKIVGHHEVSLFSAEIVVHKNREINIQCDTSKKSKIILKWKNTLCA
ncbi:urea transporter [Seonamhaeicola aphaedonensis]|uniref:Urea transporter n=1 Tax=Seonamhaeicola aphaedonensis TaxID=1461338 RepID=A0A3D9HM38_9FLAO|nr:urea transporter [Seonamhaeicola aphaedonensis]RED50572.1 urea transporter [Seonamhaeicola aphaedonensis]